MKIDPTRQHWLNQRFKQLQDAVVTFNTSRKVEPALYIGFNQEGKWYGLFDFHEFDGKVPDTTKLADHRIDPELLTVTKNGRRILLSSFTCGDTDPINLDYHEIHGLLYSQFSKSVAAFKLEKVGGRIVVENAETVDAPRLQEVGGQLNAHEVDLFRMRSLRRVGKWIDATNATIFDTPELEEVGTDIRTTNADIFLAPKLKFAGSITADKVSRFEVPMLQPTITGGVFTGPFLVPPTAGLSTELRIKACESTASMDDPKLFNRWKQTLTLRELQATIDTYPEMENREAIEQEIKVRNHTKKILKDQPDLEI